jgi:hypothetical protein
VSLPLLLSLPRDGDRLLLCPSRSLSLVRDFSFLCLFEDLLLLLCLCFCLLLLRCRFCLLLLPPASSSGSIPADRSNSCSTAQHGKAQQSTAQQAQHGTS